MEEKVFKELSKIHKIKINKNEDVISHYKDPIIKEESAGLTDFSFDLSALPPDQIEKLKAHLSGLNKESNPLSYDLNLLDAELTIKIKKNESFAPCKIKMPLLLDTFATKENFERILQNLKSRDDVDPKLKEVMIKKISNVEATLEDFYKLFNFLKKKEEAFVLCHGDLNITNILIDSNKKVFLIDLDFIGINYFYCDLAYLLGVLKLKIDLKTLIFTVSNDVEIFKDPLYKTYSGERTLTADSETFKSNLVTGEIINGMMYTVISCLNILENEKIRGLPTIQIIIDKYLILFEKFRKKEEK